MIGARKPPKYNAGPNPIKETYVDYAGGHHIVYKQNCDDVVSGVHAQRDLRPKHKKDASSEYLGSVPLLVCQIWAKECGYAIGTRGFTQYARQKLMFGDYSKFKAWLM